MTDKLPSEKAKYVKMHKMRVFIRQARKIWKIKHDDLHARFPFYPLHHNLGSLWGQQHLVHL